MGKHHCRLCGRVICQACSQVLSVNLQGHDLTHPLRACPECVQVLNNVDKSNSTEDTFLTLYNALREHRIIIQRSLSLYEDLIDRIQ